jgi:hypothetical protein
MYYGPELTAEAFVEWAEQNGVTSARNFAPGLG